MTIRNFLVLAVTLLAAASCLPAGQPPPAAPPPTTYRINLSPALPHLRQPLNTCLQLSRIPASIHVTPARSPDPEDFDLILWWGRAHTFASPSATEYAIYELGHMQVVPATASDHQLPEISLPQLSAIFQGLVQDWSLIAPAIENQAIQPITYPRNHPLRSTFSAAVLPEDTSSSDALIAPHPEAMREMLASHPGSIGYLPAPLVSPPLQPVPMQERINGLQQPVLGITVHQKTGAIVDILGCMHDSLNR